MAETPISYVPLPQGRRYLQPPNRTNTLAPAAETLGNITNILARQRGAELAEQQRIERVRVENEALEVMESARLEARKATKSTDIQRIYDERTRPIADLIDKLPDDEKPLLSAFVARRGIAHTADLATFESKMIARERAVEAGKRLEVLKSAAANGTDVDLGESEHQLRAFYVEQVGAGTMDEATAEANIASGRAEIQKSYAIGLLQRGAFDTARDAVRGGMLNSLNPSEVASIESAVKQGLGDRFVTDALLALDGGASPSAIRAQALEMRKSDRATEAQVRQVLSAAASAAQVKKDKEKDNFDAADAAARYDETGEIDRSLTKNDREAALTISWQQYASTLPPGTSRREAYANYAKNHPVLPESVMGEIAGRVLSTDTATVLAGIDEMMVVDQASGGRAKEQIPSGAESAYELARAVYRKQHGSQVPLGLGGATAVPIISAEEALADIRQERAEGRGKEQVDLRADFERKFANDRARLENALQEAMPGGGFLFALGDFTQELPFKPIVGQIGAIQRAFGYGPNAFPPHVMRVLAVTAASEAAKHGIPADEMSEAQLGAAVDVAVARMARDVGLERSTFNDSGALPEAFKIGRPALLPPEKVLDPVMVSGPDGEPINLGMGPWRAQVAMTLFESAASNLTADQPELAAALRKTLEAAGAGDDPLSRRIREGGFSPFASLLEKGHETVLGSGLTFRPEGIGGAIEKALTPEPIEFQAFEKDQLRAPINESLGLPRDLDWEPVIEATGETLEAWRFNKIAPASKQRPVEFAIYARDRSTGNRIPIYDRSTQVLGRRQLSISFNTKPKGFVNPLIVNVRKRNIEVGATAEARRQQVFEEAGDVLASGLQ